MSTTSGIPTGAAALRYWELRQQVAAHNLANANTPGFRAERVFARLLDGSVQTGAAALDLRPGALTPTDRPLDVALEGEGFFVVTTPQGERLTRGGSWRLDGEGHLADAAGNRVAFELDPAYQVPGAPLLTDASPALPAGDIQISTDGVVAVNGAAVGRLRLVQPAAGALLYHEPGALLRSDRGTAAIAVNERRVHQGQLEESNVAVLDGMVEMIEIQRAFASVQRTMTLLDGALDTAVNRLGRVG